MSAGLYGVLGALVLGVAGVVVGFFGPLLFAPQDNQGPLLAFFLGPAGAVVGFVVGFLVGRSRGGRA